MTKHSARPAPRPISKFRSLTGIVTLIALITGVLGWQGWKWTRHYIECRPVTFYAWRLPSGEVFLAEDPQNPQLQAYARREKISDIIRPFHSDMEKVFALCQWASKTFPNTNPFPNYPPWNASVILDWIRHGKTGGFCAQYAFVFGQACQSQGYFVRYFDVAAPENMTGHFTVEVYLPSQKRWVIFEPTWGTYYVDAEGRPLDMLGLHEHAVGVKKDTVFEYPTKQPVPLARIRLFYYFRYYLRNNFLTVPVYAMHPEGAWSFEPYRLAWIDPFTKITQNLVEAIPTSNPADFNYQIDVAHPPKEVWCKKRQEFVLLAAATPALKMLEVHMPRCALSRLVRMTFVNDPRFHRLTS